VSERVSVLESVLVLARVLIADVEKASSDSHVALESSADIELSVALESCVALVPALALESLPAMVLPHCLLRWLLEIHATLVSGRALS